MRQAASLRDGILPSAGEATVWSIVIILLLAAGSPPLQACDGGTAVPDPENNPGLVADCTVLLGLRDELAVTASLNWDTGLAITDWEGINVSGLPGRVSRLDLKETALTGTIPPELGRLSQLQELHLFNNELTGPIPPELGQLTRLQELPLYNNQLAGEIPPELGQLTRLQYLTLYNNQLTGPIPPELGQLTRLQELPLYNNQLTGPIPPELGQLTRLQELPLYNNQLTGPIPPELGQLTRLQYLTLFNNRLTGEIPPELGQLSQLQYLTLHNNQLSGEIPVELGQLSQLWSLALDHNQLTGEIPPQLGQLSQLRWLTLDHNELTGEIPPELGQLSQLRWLHLQHNELTGPIPPQLGQLSNLTQFSFRGNRLTGPVPSELSHLPEGTVEEFALDFAHFANGASLTSDLVLVNVAAHPIRSALYFYDKEGNPIDPESVVDLTGDLEVQEDGALSVRSAMAPLGELTISTHGQGELVTGSVTVSAKGPIGGVLRYARPDIGVAGVGVGQPVRDALFPARRQAGGINTAAALHNLGEEADDGELPVDERRHRARRGGDLSGG